ncbi:hypothetical protein MLD38_016304 [Melastoma candidum]|uniref:Uncharacterized protein n=1 Tax=Melastoma candidum TaxID=119954 RepID=A0ACB9RIK4_9MYRT|nr:hypothetical protein MLD38_016304 [Melastoma candidum]
MGDGSGWWHHPSFCFVRSMESRSASSATHSSRLMRMMAHLHMIYNLVRCSRMSIEHCLHDRILGTRNPICVGCILARMYVNPSQTAPGDKEFRECLVCKLQF